jgi:hypothetical protein
MAAIVVFHILLFLLGLGVVTRSVPTSRVGSTLGYLHNAIGITTPSAGQVRMVALIWIGSILVMIDGCLFLLVFSTRISSL